MFQWKARTLTNMSHMIPIHYRITIVQYIVANKSSRTLFNTIDIPLVKNTNYKLAK